MANIRGTTRAQTKFLRAFRTDPTGPGIEKWPSPAILRRWLRRPGFVQAMRAMRDAMRYQADFQLLAAAASAAHALHDAVASPDDAKRDARQMKAMSDLMKLAHVRQRFAPEDPPPAMRESVLEELVCTAHPQAPIEALLAVHRRHSGRDLKAEWNARRDAEVAAGIRRIGLVEIPINMSNEDDLDDESVDDNASDRHGAREPLD